jgi:hypothetical protein
MGQWMAVAVGVRDGARVALMLLVNGLEEIVAVAADADFLFEIVELDGYERAAAGAAVDLEKKNEK